MPLADMPPVDLEALTQELPQPQQDDAASPEDVRHEVFEQQVEDAEECIQKLRKTLDAIDDGKEKHGADYKHQMLRVDSEHRRV